MIMRTLPLSLRNIRLHTLLNVRGWSLIGSALCMALVLFAATAARAQSASPAKLPAHLPVRLQGDISDSQRTRLPGSQHPLAQPRYESGRVPADTRLQGMSLVFSRTQTQKADLLALIAEQQNPSSPQFHKWLTPDQFAARFGVAQSDLDKATQWLQQQGFSVDRTARSRNRLFFSGSVHQVEAAFATELHYYTIDGKKQFAPSTAISLPSALAGVVESVGDLNSFRPKSMLKKFPNVAAKPDFTSGLSGSHFTGPGDIATIYDLQPVYSAGLTGAGQSIAILGQSAIYVSDVEHFQTASGWTTPVDPTLVLVPGTGAGDLFLPGDETESDVDLEWASTIAPDATIFFVFTGDGSSNGVFDSLAYSVDERIAPIISLSYGGCEPAFPSDEITAIEDVNQQAAAQGQTLLAASGDDGASGCLRDTNLGFPEQAELAVSYPASSPYFTAVGGTEFNEGTGTYWTSNGTNDVINSAISYIPEVVWNDDNPLGVGASGGGVSILFPKPSWQTGVPGIPSDGVRDVPDISLDSAAGNDPLLLCSTDTAAWHQGQVNSCDKGFRDSATGDLTYDGGTSFATPIFAGMLALINQKENSTGQGVLNPQLYSLASNPTTYSSAFHDITTGSNECLSSDTVKFCPNGPTGYSATTGYDLTTGLGSIDLYNLITAWGTPTLAGSFTKITTPTLTPVANSSVPFTITVTPQSGTTVPTGTISLAVDGAVANASLSLVNGAVTYSYTISGSGSHIAVATYSGDSNFGPSTNTLTLSSNTVTTTTVSASSSSPVVGKSDIFTILVEPQIGIDHPTGSLNVLVDGATAQSGLQLSANSVATFATKFQTAGTHTVSVTYVGDAEFATSTGSVTVNAVSNAIATTATVTAANNAPNVGANDTFNITIAPASGTATPSGTVSIAIDGAATANPATLTNGAATFTTAFTTAGTHTVTATWAGDTNFTKSTASVTVNVVPNAVATTTTVTAASKTPSLGANDTFTITVTPATGTAAPSGTVSISVDGAATATPANLTNGVATFTTAFTTSGAHTVSATWAGDASFITSTGSATVNVPPGSFTLSGTALSITQGASGASTITITPANGYNGTVSFGVTASPALGNACIALASATVSGGTPATSSLSISTNAPVCPASALTHTAQLIGNRPTPPSSGGTAQTTAAATLVGLLFAGLLGRRSRKLRAFAALAFVITLGIFVSGCGGSSKPTNVDVTPKGTYTLTITGTDKTTSTITATTTVNLTVN
jgi:subtilase family serine protease